MKKKILQKNPETQTKMKSIKFSSNKKVKAQIKSKTLKEKILVIQGNI